MIAARLWLDADGSLLRFEARGHAGLGKAGSDILCSAFSVFARTAYESLAALPGAELDGVAARPGELFFTVRRMGPESRDRALGMTGFLLTGLSSLEREFPGRLALTIERNWRE